MVKYSEHKVDSEVNLGQSCSSIDQFVMENSTNTNESWKRKILPSKKSKKTTKARKIICMTITILLWLVLIMLIAGIIIQEKRLRQLFADISSMQNNFTTITEHFMSHQKVIQDLKDKQNELDFLSENINETLYLAIPIGFTYTQLPFQSEPSVLWNWAIWQQITDNYSGHFFRAEGGNSAPFGESQLDSVQNHPVWQSLETIRYEMAKKGNSVKNEEVVKDIKDLRMSDETRPINYAIRIWQRIG